MKLVVKSLKEIDAAVAEHVAGWKRIQTELHKEHGGYVTSEKPEKFVCYCDEAPAFTRSADAVLPLLDGFMWSARNTLDCGRFAKHLSRPEENGKHYIKVRKAAQEWDAIAPTFPLVACIALLRAKGIEVEIISK